MRTLIIDYDAIVDHLRQEDGRESERTWGPLDILLYNTQHALASIVNVKSDDEDDETSVKRSIAVDIDDEKKTVTVFGNEIHVNEKELVALAYMRDKPLTEQLYEIITGAEDRAQNIGTYTNFFSTLKR